MKDDSPPCGSRPAVVQQSCINDSISSQAEGSKGSVVGGTRRVLKGDREGAQGLGLCVIKVYLTVDLCARPFTQALGLEQLEQCRFIFKGGIAMKQSHY